MEYLIPALIVLWLAAVIFFRINRIWVLYYLVGSVGLALVLIYVTTTVLNIDYDMERLVAMSTHQVAGMMGIVTEVFSAAPGSLLVLIVAQEKGWTVIEVTIECSSILESSVLIGMLMFYPGWSLFKKAYLGLIGLMATYAANIIRLIMIVSVLSKMGKDSLFMTHTILGRLLFFILSVITYWIILTRPTLKDVHRKLRQELVQ